MYRCALVATCLALTTLSACAQQHRFFPAKALRGELVITQHPDALLNGQPVRLAPGSRVKGDTNLLLQPAGLAGQKLTVNYTVEPSGLLMDVWVLNPVEAANNPWPRTPAESATWQFNPGNQTWVKP